MEYVLPEKWFYVYEETAFYYCPKMQYWSYRSTKDVFIMLCAERTSWNDEKELYVFAQTSVFKIEEFEPVL